MNIYNTNIYTYVRELDIPVGHSRRVECPNCGERTLSVTNEMGSLLWNCFRASCGIKGGSKVALSTKDILTAFHGTTKDEEEFVLPDYLVPYNYDVAEWASELYGLDAEELGLLYDVREHRVVFPVYDGNKIVDAAGRSLGKRIPKWRRYGKSGLPYTHGCGNVAVVVEDCVSAAVVGFGSFVGVAILGTQLSESHKGFLTRFSTAVIALDPDALTKSLQFVKELRGYVNDVRVLRLTDDLKYRNPTDMENLYGIITD